MIGEGLFTNQLHTCFTILSRANLLERRNPFPNKRLGASDFKGMSYREEYQKDLQEYAYDFILKDQSLLLFVTRGNDEHDGHLSYSFNECPIEAPEYIAFVCSELGIDRDDPSSGDILEEFGDTLIDDYWRHLGALDHKHQVTPIRYDYKALDYEEGRHPAPHFHFGVSNNIRIGTVKVLNPISSTLFIVRQFYPDQWMRVLAHSSKARWCSNVRETLDDIDNNYVKLNKSFEIVLF